MTPALQSASSDRGSLSGRFFWRGHRTACFLGSVAAVPGVFEGRGLNFLLRRFLLWKFVPGRISETWENGEEGQAQDLGSCAFLPHRMLACLYLGKKVGTFLSVC